MVGNNEKSQNVAIYKWADTENGTGELVGATNLQFVREKEKSYQESSNKWKCIKRRY